MQETTIKTPLETGELFTPSHGRGKLRNGGTNKGGPGRPPESWRRELQTRCSPEQIDDMLKAARDKGDVKLEFEIRKFCAEQAFGRPNQSMETKINYAERIIRLPEKVACGFGSEESSQKEA